MRIENRPKLHENPAEKFELQRLSDDELSNARGAMALVVGPVAVAVALVGVVVWAAIKVWSQVEAPNSFTSSGKNAV